MIPLRRMIQSERGIVAMSVVMAFMAFALPIVTATLAFTATAAISSRESRNASTNQFTVTGAMDYAIYKLVHVDTFRQSLSGGDPAYESITLNNSDGLISWTKRVDPGGTSPTEIATLQTTKTVTPTSVPANSTTDVTYTIQVENVGGQNASLVYIKDSLPSGFDYVTGTTTGATTADPTVSHWDDGNGNHFTYLKWQVSTDLAPSASLSISFEASLSNPDGYYCNVAWTQPGSISSGTGPTAKIKVGTPTDTLCDNEAIQVRATVTPSSAVAGVSQTFHYRIEIENNSSTTRTACGIVDLLPKGFTFVIGSVTGDITGTNPFLWTNSDGQHARWVFCSGSNTGIPISPGTTKYLEYDATAQPDTGVYDNQVWVSFASLLNSAYSGPTAEVSVFDVYDVSVSNSTTSVTAQVWMDSNGSYYVTEWQVNNTGG